MPDSQRALTRPVAVRPVGSTTRGTTNPNRLRRVDRWLAGPQAGRLRGGAPVVVEHNEPGERVHDWLQALDRAWEVHAPLRVHGARQRWLATVSTVKQEGWPVLHGPTRWRLGEVGIPWRCVSAD